MPASPRPWRRVRRAAARRRRRRPRPRAASSRSATDRGGAGRRASSTLVSASCTMRYAETSTAGGTGAHGATLSSTSQAGGPDRLRQRVDPRQAGLGRAPRRRTRRAGPASAASPRAPPGRPLDRAQARAGPIRVAVEHVGGAPRPASRSRRGCATPRRAAPGRSVPLLRTASAACWSRASCSSRARSLRTPDHPADQPDRAEEDRRGEGIRAASVPLPSTIATDRASAANPADSRASRSGAYDATVRSRPGWPGSRVELQRLRGERPAGQHGAEQGDPERRPTAHSEGQGAERDRDQVQPGGPADDVLRERSDEYLVPPDGRSIAGDRDVQQQAAGEARGPWCGHPRTHLAAASSDPGPTWDPARGPTIRTPARPYLSGTDVDDGVPNRRSPMNITTRHLALTAGRCSRPPLRSTSRTTRRGLRLDPGLRSRGGLRPVAGGRRADPRLAVRRPRLGGPAGIRARLPGDADRGVRRRRHARQRGRGPGRTVPLGLLGTMLGYVVLAVADLRPGSSPALQASPLQ